MASGFRRGASASRGQDEYVETDKGEQAADVVRMLAN